jgi:DNA-binding NtrC family response regulator
VTSRTSHDLDRSLARTVVRAIPLFAEGRRMGETDEPRATVLVVDDERGLTDLYAAWLSGAYDVRTAYGGEEALRKMEGVDAVVLDRRMPDLSGDAVLARIADRGPDPYVAMVTAVEPDFDIVAMGFDDYVVKPVAREQLRRTVEQLLALEECQETTRELFALAEKRAALEARKNEAALRESPEYRRLCDRIERLQARTDELVTDLDEQSYRALLSDITAGAVE